MRKEVRKQLVLGIVIILILILLGYVLYSSGVLNKLTGKVIDANLQAVYRCYDATTGNHMLSKYSNCDPNYPTYWTSEFIIGYLYKTQQTGTSILYRCWSEARKEHFTSKDCVAEGGTINDVLGYASSSQQINTQAVYRCYWKEKNEYFDSLSSNCEGYIVNSTLGWFLKTNIPPNCIDYDYTSSNAPDWDDSYFKKSYVRYKSSLGWANKNDSCSGKYLSERYCDSSGNYKSKTIYCKKGCANSACNVVPSTYPYYEGQLSFPKDEGRHSILEVPFTVAEWPAIYGHLVADDSSSYFFFSTMVTYDPAESQFLQSLIGVNLGENFFPHQIFTLSDENNQRVYSYFENDGLKKFDYGHLDVETNSGSYLRWKGTDKPFQYHLYQRGTDSYTNTNYMLDLDLYAVKPPLLLDGEGFVVQVAGVNGHFALTRLNVSGSITINDKTKPVKGILWLDRQWIGAGTAISGASSLNFNPPYEWFGIQLDNGEEAVFYRIWDLEGGNFIASKRFEINHKYGKREAVTDYTFENMGYWDSPDTGLRYSSGWRLNVPSLEWDLYITPTFKSQEVSSRFWEGGARVSGTINGVPVTGKTAVELLYTYPLSGGITSDVSTSKFVTNKTPSYQFFPA